MGSSKRLDFVTELKPEVQGIKAIASEKHNGQQCRYVKRSEIRNVNGKSENYSTGSEVVNVGMKRIIPIFWMST